MVDYIDREKLLKEICKDKCGSVDGKCVTMERCYGCQVIEKAPAADVVEVVRCKDCEWCVDLGVVGLYCTTKNLAPCRSDGFCDQGRKRGEEE